MTVGDTPTCLQGRSPRSLPGSGPTKLPSPWGGSHERGAENFSRGYQTPTVPSTPHPRAPYA